MFEPNNMIREHECDICGEIAMCEAIDIDIWACEKCIKIMEIKMEKSK